MGVYIKKIESLYIHFPFCRHLCNYCDFYKAVPKSKGEVSSFEKQFEQMLDKHESFLIQNDLEIKELETLYIGGGTPSLWGKEGALFLKELFFQKNIKLKPSGEFTLEVNPGTWSEEGISAWREFGINRFSLGIQSLRMDYLKVLDRVHSVEDVFETLNYFNKSKFNFSVDFMLGLPHSKTMNRDVLKELQEILAFEPSHISLYILTAKSNYKFKNDLPDEEFLESEFLSVASYLSDKCFSHYEVSNFSKPGFESEHNLRYWQSESVAALGPSAVGLLSEERLRYKWKAKGAQLEVENLSSEQYLLESLYMAMRTNRGFRPQEFFAGKAQLIEPILGEWSEHGLGEGNFEHFCLSSKGLLVLDGLIDRLLPHC
jgi:oxygen-independent coproporphyrinogen-3 oxidase